MLFTILLLRTSRKNGYKLWVQWRLGLFGWTSISYHWPMVFQATINQSLEYACPPKWSQKMVLPGACTHSRYSFWSSPLSYGHDAPCLTPVPPPAPPPPKKKNCCITVAFDFSSWDDCNIQEKLETMVIQMFFCGAGGLNKMHYGLCENNEQAINLGENYI